MTWHCANCGHVYVIEHRLSRQEKWTVRESAEPDYQDDEVHIGAESFIRQTEPLTDRAFRK